MMSNPADKELLPLVRSECKAAEEHYIIKWLKDDEHVEKLIMRNY